MDQELLDLLRSAWGYKGTTQERHTELSYRTQAGEFLFFPRNKGNWEWRNNRVGTRAEEACEPAHYSFPWTPRLFNRKWCSPIVLWKPRKGLGFVPMLRRVESKRHAQMGRHRGRRTRAEMGGGYSGSSRNWHTWSQIPKRQGNFSSFFSNEALSSNTSPCIQCYPHPPLSCSPSSGEPPPQGGKHSAHRAQDPLPPPTKTSMQEKLWQSHWPSGVKMILC